MSRDPQNGDTSGNMIFARRLAAALFLLLSVVCSSLFANIEITLKDDFIEQFKDRATISVSFVVDKAHRHPNPPKNDADLHAAGRAEEVGLPIVAEIMNASSQKSAVDAIHQAEGTENPIPLTCIPSPGFKDFNAVSSGESFTKTILSLCTSKLPFRS